MRVLLLHRQCVCLDWSLIGLAQTLDKIVDRSHGLHVAFGSFVLYYSGSVGGAPSSDMPPVATIDDFIERLCESNE